MYVFLLMVATLVCGAVATFMIGTTKQGRGAAVLTLIVTCAIGVFLYAGGGHRYHFFPRIET